jgi:hypothetical protein
VPHVVIEGVGDLSAFARVWQPFVVRRGPDILRADHLFLSADARSCLIDALCVEAGRKQPFYVKLAVHDRGSATVRVDPMTHPERSEGVRDLVAQIGARLLRATPGGRVGATNLTLPEPESGPAREPRA